RKMVDFNKEFFMKLLCEFFASLFVQFFGCAFTGAPGANSIQHALTWGGAVLGATQAFRIVSGAHINPCISIAAMILKNIEIAEGLFYILIQLLGSAGGFGIAYGIVRRDSMKKTFCVTNVVIDPWWKSILLEFYMTGAWVFAMCASWNVANENMLETISLRIGLVVAIGHLVGGYETGCSMNPFRALWPAIAANYWDYVYVPVAVPIVTAILLGLAWRFLYLQGNDESKPGAAQE
ncbi:hypothetical protein KR222_005157, partial [Zaprionus bogoriensis]